MQMTRWEKWLIENSLPPDPKHTRVLTFLRVLLPFLFHFFFLFPSFFSFFLYSLLQRGSEKSEQRLRRTCVAWLYVCVPWSCYPFSSLCLCKCVKWTVSPTPFWQFAIFEKELSPTLFNCPVRPLTAPKFPPKDPLPVIRYPLYNLGFLPLSVPLQMCSIDFNII